jgi:hypothetical protein
MLADKKINLFWQASLAPSGDVPKHNPYPARFTRAALKLALY